MVVDDGEAVGLATEVLLSPVAGDQEYVYGEVPPEPVGLPPIPALPPKQIATSAPASTVGVGLTVTRTESVAQRPRG